MRRRAGSAPRPSSVPTLTVVPEMSLRAKRSNPPRKVARHSRKIASLAMTGDRSVSVTTLAAARSPTGRHGASTGRCGRPVAYRRTRGHVLACRVLAVPSVEAQPRKDTADVRLADRVAEDPPPVAAGAGAVLRRAERQPGEERHGRAGDVPVSAWAAPGCRRLPARCSSRPTSCCPPPRASWRTASPSRASSRSTSWPRCC